MLHEVFAQLLASNVSNTPYVPKHVCVDVQVFIDVSHHLMPGLIPARILAARWGFIRSKLWISWGPKCPPGMIPLHGLAVARWEDMKCPPDIPAMYGLRP